MSPTSRAWLWALMAGLAVVLLRTVGLENDPPPSMPEGNPMDEGLWADGARGAFLFSDWFADDTGNALVVTPLHSLLVLGSYELFGLGLWQTRLPATLCGIGLCLLLGYWTAGRLGPRWGALTAVLVALCPLLDQHSRSGLLESEQLFWMALSFCLLFSRRRAPWHALLAGAAMALACATKPNAVTVGVLPLIVAFCVEWFTAYRGDGGAVHPSFRRRAALAVLGGALGLLPFALFVWLPHFDVWMEASYAESGSDQWTFGEHLLQLGFLFDREGGGDVHRLWAPLRHAGFAAFGAWLWLLGRRRGQTSPDERAVALWALLVLVVVELWNMHVGRRQLLLVPPLLLLTVFALAREFQPGPRAAQEPATPRPLASWLLLTLPLLVVAKPLAANALTPQLGSRPAGLLVVACWPAGCWLLARLLGDPLRLRRVALRAGPWLAALLLLAGATTLGAFRDYGRTILAAQATMRERVEPGETVFGQNATIVFLAAPVRTVRRVVLERNYATPRFNPKAFERLQPRYLLDYRDAALREMQDLRDGYQAVAPVDVLRERDGTWRYQLELLERAR